MCWSGFKQICQKYQVSRRTTPVLITLNSDVVWLSIGKHDCSIYLCVGMPFVSLLYRRSIENRNWLNLIWYFAYCFSIEMYIMWWLVCASVCVYSIRLSDVSVTNREKNNRVSLCCSGKVLSRLLINVFRYRRYKPQKISHNSLLLLVFLLAYDNSGKMFAIV